jgi:peptide/nickel transport system substrate-binding protein
VRVSRRSFLITAAAMMAATACAPAQPASKPADAKPTEAKPAASPAAESKPASPVAAPAASPAAAASKPGEQPRSGGELSFVVGAEPPSFDAHREITFAMVHPTAPHYSLLVKFDPQRYPEIVGDVAESWEASPDRLAYTFKLRDGVKFHDGSACTSRDVKASYDKILNPPEGVISARRAQYSAIDSVEAPDPRTVAFRLKYPSAGILTLLASPFNYIYSADKLQADPRWYEKNILGTGPFKFGEYVPGSHWTGSKNADYFIPGQPYLDGFRATFIRETAAQVQAVRGGRAQVEFRGFTPSARDDLQRALGDGIVVQEGPWMTSLLVQFNTEKPPFNDARVRRALNLAVDRWEGSNALSRITFVKPVGALMRPGSQFARPDAELEKMEGFSRNVSAAREQAKQLLREAGVPDGFAFTLKNRDVPQPYEPTGVFLIDQWRRIGLNVTQQAAESSAYLADLRNGNYDAALNFLSDYVDEPDVQLSQFLSTDRSPSNTGRYTDRELDALFDQQSREGDPQRRNQIVWQFEDRVINQQAYTFPIIWWQRIVPHAASLRGWELLPNHFVNQDLADVWLAQ